MTTEQWEHLILEDSSLRKITENLNILGREGWEGTGIAYYRGGFNGLYMVLLKRRLD
jgi:hypothetical protein